MTLYIFRGLPGCGKSTQAREMQAALGGIVVERDEIRFTLYGTYYNPDLIDEKLVTEYQNTLIDMSLQMRMNVYVSDMNLRNSYVKRLIEKAWEFDGEYEIIDMTDVPLDVCLSNNESPSRQVQGKVVDRVVIRDLYERFIARKGHPLPVNFTGVKISGKQWQSYVPDTSKPNATIWDIDGTLALMNGRGPFDEHLVNTDKPNKAVFEMMSASAEREDVIVIMSGRTEGCREMTEQWLLQHAPWLDYHWAGVRWQLYMRAVGDMRGDDIVKHELFYQHVAPRYNVRYVTDDRNKVVKMWRAIGLTVAQVAEGDF